MISEMIKKPDETSSIWYARTEYTYLGAGIIFVLAILTCSWKKACGKKAAPEVHDTVEQETPAKQETLTSDPHSDSESESETENDDEVQDNVNNIV